MDELTEALQRVAEARQISDQACLRVWRAVERTYPEVARDVMLLGFDEVQAGHWLSQYQPTFNAVPANVLLDGREADLRKHILRILHGMPV